MCNTFIHCIHSNFNGFFLAVTSNQQRHNPLQLPVPTNMVTNPSSEATSADFRKQRAVLKKDLQRKFERWDKDPHDRTRYLKSKSLLESWGITFFPTDSNP